MNILLNNQYINISRHTKRNAKENEEYKRVCYANFTKKNTKKKNKKEEHMTKLAEKQQNWNDIYIHKYLSLIHSCTEE